MAPNDKRVLENRLRRMAERQGLMARKSPRRDPLALEYDRWSLAWRDTDVVITDGFDLTHAELERFLTRDIRLYGLIMKEMIAQNDGPVPQAQAIRQYVDRTADLTQEEGS